MLTLLLSFIGHVIVMMFSVFHIHNWCFYRLMKLFGMSYLPTSKKKLKNFQIFPALAPVFNKKLKDDAKHFHQTIIMLFEPYHLSLSYIRPLIECIAVHHRSSIIRSC